MSFTLKDTQQLTEINSIGYVYEHNKTKATVMFIINDDTNKAFSIAFATPPQNNNGIAHILEHSVLCGSRKYPTKEPFVELAKGSLNTFLNAFTSADHTTYPVASQNAKDFNNLMDVYLDAVFYPNLINNPLILAQEGWHYHLENDTDDLIYKGVVYNEMKGAYSDPTTILYQEAKKALFPDTIYANESGGHPLHIPTLTQEEFVAFHQTYYHPSNAMTFFYGNVDIEEQLSRLETYFNDFEYREIDKAITTQLPFTQIKECVVPYAIAQDETTDYKTYLSLEYVIGHSTNVQDNVNYAVLHDILLGSNASPLWKALIEANIASDVDGGYNNHLYQSTFDITLINSELVHKDEFLNIVNQTLRDIVATGIDETLFQSAINKNKFAIKEAAMNGSFPKGVAYGMSVTNQWLYNGGLFDTFFVEKALNHLEEHPELLLHCIETGLLNNTHAIFMAGIPTPGLNDRLFENVHQQLQTYKNSLSDFEIDTIITKIKALQAYQNEPDSPQALATIPLLSLNDLNANAASLALEVQTKNDTTYLYHPTFTSGIAYVQYYFDTRVITYQQLPYVSLMAKLLGSFPTDTYSVDDLANLENLHTGGIDFSTTLFIESTKQGAYYPKFVVKGKAFHDKLSWLNQLISDMLLRTNFDDKVKLKEQLLKIKSRYEAKLMYQSHTVATHRVRSYYSQAAKYEQQFSGIDFYIFVRELLENFDDCYTTILDNLNHVQQTLFNQHQLQVGFIGQMDDAQSQWDSINQFVAQLPNKQLPQQPFEGVVAPLNEAFVLAQDVQYVAQGFNYTLDDFVYDARLRVLKNILSYTYLWNTIRVQGGAYGAFNVQTRDGDFILCSYRDPNVKETLTTYANAGNFVANLALDERELTKAIIGTFSELDRPLSPKETGEVAFIRHLTHTTLETIQQERHQLLQTTVEQLQTLSSYIASAISKNYYCVVGNKVILEQNRDAFNSITTLIK